MPDPTSDSLEPLIQRWLQSDDPDALLEQLCREHPEHEAALRSRCGSTRADEVEPDAPTQVGPYRILDVLGEGGMGTVFLAEQREPVRRRVALKLIKLGMDSKAVVRRFEQERQALALMDHEGIAKAYDCGTNERGQPYFVMELVKGVPLDTYCEQQRLSLAERLQLMQQVCAAVQHAHQKGVIHRDLKPGNVLVSDLDGRLQIKIIDFGLAKAVGKRLIEESLFTELGSVIGTPEYMAPEQADPTNLDVDTRADVYSLGVMLYQLLVGQLPFSSAELRAAGMLEMQRVLREVDAPKPSTKLTTAGDHSTKMASQLRVSPSALKKALKSDLDWVVVKALEKDRSRRYESASEFAADLQRFLAHEPLQAGPPSALYRLQKLLRRHRAPVLAAGLVLLALVVGGATAYVQWDRAAALATSEAAARLEAQRALKVAQESKDAALESERAARASEREARESAALAQQEATRAERSIAFLEDVIETASPDGAKRPDLTVRELFSEMAERLEADEQLQEQPAVKVRLLYTVGLVYSSLGFPSQAGAVWQQALDIWRARELPPTVQVGLMLSYLGDRAEPGSAEVQQAKALLKEAMEVFDALGEEGERWRVYAEGTLAKYRMAEATGGDAQMAIFAGVLNFKLGRGLGSIAQTRRELEALMQDLDADWRAGRRAEALQRLRDLFDQIPGTKTKREIEMMMVAMKRFAAWCRERGLHTVAEPVMRGTLQIARKELGDGRATSVSAVNLSDYLLRRGEISDAAELVESARRYALEHGLRPLDRFTITARSIRLQLRLEPTADVKPQLAELADAGAEHFDDVEANWLYYAVVGELDAVGRAAEAVGLVEQLLGGSERAAAESPDASLLRVKLAQLQARARRFDEAEANLLAAWPAIEAGEGLPDGVRAKAAAMGAEVYELWEKPDEARRWRERQ